MTGIIYFKSDKARNFLLKNGFVYTLRAHTRKTGVAWLHDGKRLTGVKVKVRFVKKIFWLYREDLVDSLRDFVDKSGFKNLAEWLTEMYRLVGYMPRTIYVYLVTVVKG